MGLRGCRGWRKFMIAGHKVEKEFMES